MRERKTLWIGLGVVHLAIILACSGVTSGTTRSLTALREADQTTRRALAADAVGRNDAQGVPSYPDRIEERGILPVAVLQQIYWVKGAAAAQLSDRTQYGRLVRIRTVSAPAIQVPAQLGFGLSYNALQDLEAALRRNGFEVIPHARVIRTQAYQNAYRGPIATYHDGGLRAGWAGFAPIQGSYVREFADIEVGGPEQLWVDAEVMQAISEELGRDVLFLTVSHQLGTYHGDAAGSAQMHHQGEISCNSGMVINDPRFAGYGVGDFGHTISGFRVQVDPAPNDWIESTDMSDRRRPFRLHWERVIPDARIISEYVAEAFAVTLKSMAGDAMANARPTSGGEEVEAAEDPVDPSPEAATPAEGATVDEDATSDEAVTPGEDATEGATRDDEAPSDEGSPSADQPAADTAPAGAGAEPVDDSGDHAADDDEPERDGADSPEDAGAADEVAE